MINENRYNCNNCTKEGRLGCRPDVKPECELRLPIGYQMMDNDRKISGFVSMMDRLRLKIETVGPTDFVIVQS